MPWRFDPTTGRYRDTDTGRFLSLEAVREFVDQSLAGSRDAVGDIAQLVADGRLSVGDWQNRMRQEIKEEYIRQYLLGRGGRNVMGAADWGSVGGMLADQFRYLRGFAEDVETGDLSAGRIAGRSKMYVNSAREAFERGNARAQGIPNGALPAFPGDGTTICLTSCRCFWEIVPVADGWNAYWRTTPAEHCQTCLDRSSAWNPYHVPLEGRVQLPKRRKYAPDHKWKHVGGCDCQECGEGEINGEPSRYSVA